MPWLDAPDPPEPAWRAVLAGVVIGAFLLYCLVPWSSELWGAYRPREVDSAVDVTLWFGPDGGAE